jgi:hypothetical protein
MGTEDQVVACNVLLPFVNLKYLQIFQKFFHCGLIYYLYYLHTKKCSDFRLEKRSERFRKQAGDGTQLINQNNHA